MSKDKAGDPKPKAPSPNVEKKETKTFSTPKYEAPKPVPPVKDKK